MGTNQARSSEMRYRQKKFILIRRSPETAGRCNAPGLVWRRRNAQQRLQTASKASPGPLATAQKEPARGRALGVTPGHGLLQRAAVGFDDRAVGCCSS